MLGFRGVANRLSTLSFNYTMNSTLFFACFAIFCALLPGKSNLVVYFLNPALWAQALFFSLIYIRESLS